MYGNFVPIKKIKLKPKDLKSMCIKLEIKRSSKRKQRLYNKFLKERTLENEAKY